VKVEGGIARIFLNRPEKVNALDGSRESAAGGFQNLSEQALTRSTARSSGRDSRPEHPGGEAELEALLAAPLAASIAKSIELFTPAKR
jgi:hypothetical protein